MSRVKYICLEGGGGRGTVYLGVVKALEDSWLVPIPKIPLGPERILVSSIRNPTKRILSLSGIC